MMSNFPRMRMFAGPNGSGKSTVKSEIDASLLGFYINPDDIEKSLRATSIFDLNRLSIQTTQYETVTFFKQSGLFPKMESSDQINNITYQNGIINFHDLPISSYVSSILADFLRHKFLEARQTFTFETVMSSSDKIELLKKAQSLGYRTYLYYVSTEDPQINIARVANRVRLGGHNVPTDKIISRYYKSLDLLFEAIKHTNRAYIFDNSGDTKRWIAEITEAKSLDIQADEQPEWFIKYVTDKI
jgi:predicted ABC-type ATPase